MHMEMKCVSTLMVCICIPNCLYTSYSIGTDLFYVRILDYEFPTYNISENDKDDRDDCLACKLQEMPPRCPLPIDEFG